MYHPQRARELQGSELASSSSPHSFAKAVCHANISTAEDGGFNGDGDGDGDDDGDGDNDKDSIDDNDDNDDKEDNIDDDADDDDDDVDDNEYDNDKTKVELPSASGSPPTPG
jgi:hypothetical protein